MEVQSDKSSFSELWKRLAFVAVLLFALPFTAGAAPNWAIELNNPVQAAVPGGMNTFSGRIKTSGGNVSIVSFTLKWKASTTSKILRARPATDLLATKFQISGNGYDGKFFTVQVPADVSAAVQALGIIYFELDDGASSYSFELPFALDPSPTVSTPRLSIRQAQNQIEVSWTGNRDSFVIETTAALPSPAWTTTTYPVSTLNGVNSVILPASAKSIFVRAARRL